MYLRRNILLFQEMLRYWYTAWCRLPSCHGDRIRPTPPLGGSTPASRLETRYNRSHWTRSQRVTHLETFSRASRVLRLRIAVASRRRFDSSQIVDDTLRISSACRRFAQLGQIIVIVTSACPRRSTVTVRGMFVNNPGRGLARRHTHIMPRHQSSSFGQGRVTGGGLYSADIDSTSSVNRRQISHEAPCALTSGSSSALVDPSDNRHRRKALVSNKTTTQKRGGHQGQYYSTGHGSLRALRCFILDLVLNSLKEPLHITEPCRVLYVALEQSSPSLRRPSGWP